MLYETGQGDSNYWQEVKTTYVRRIFLRGISAHSISLVDIRYGLIMSKAVVSNVQI